MPLSCHLMLTAGPRASFGLLSPGDRPIERGDRFTVAFGVWGALDCRAGLRGRGRGRAAGRRSGTTSSGSWRPTSRRSPSGTARCASARPAARSTTIIDAPAGRPVLRHLPQPRPPDRPRRVGQLADRGRLDGRAPVRDGVPGRRHPGHRHRLLHDQHRGRRGARRRDRCAPRSPPATRPPGRGSRRAGGSCANRSGSSSTTTSCRSRTSRRTCRRSCSVPTAR